MHLYILSVSFWLSLFSLYQVGGDEENPALMTEYRRENRKRVGLLIIHIIN